MIETNKLQAKMKERGYTIDTLSKAMSLSKNGFCNKLHNKSEFLASEIQKIGQLLNLDITEMLAIFFASFVDYKSTKWDWKNSNLKLKIISTGVIRENSKVKSKNEHLGFNSLWETTFLWSA